MVHSAARWEIKKCYWCKGKKLGAETWKEIIQILVGWGNKEGGVQLGCIEKREHAEVQKGTKRAL